MYPPVFEELGKIRALDLRQDGGQGPRRPRPKKRRRVRRVVGSRLVSVGTRMMRGVA